MIVGKLHVGDLVGPGTWVGPIEDLKVCFYLLVNTFSLAIRLGAVSGGKGEVIVQEFSKFFGKGGGELWATI